MYLDGIVSSSVYDSSGEILQIENCDISDFLNPDVTAPLNWEHRSGDKSTVSDILGQIIFAKKLLDESCCTTKRQLDFYRKLGLPCIYIICRLYDDTGHTGALDLVAIIKNQIKHSGRITIYYSIEGSTLEKDESGHKLVETIGRGAAITLKPANRSAVIGVLPDPESPKTKDILENLTNTIKSDNPLYKKLFTGEVEFASIPDELAKTTTAGGYNAVPSTLTGGSALQVEDRGLKIKNWTNRARAALRDWDKKGDFEKFLKNQLPDADPGFINRFSNMVNEVKLKTKKHPKPENDEQYRSFTSITSGGVGTGLAGGGIAKSLNERAISLEKLAIDLASIYGNK